MLGQDLDGDGAVQAGVSRLIDLSHAPCTEGGLDLVGAEGGARLKWHGYGTGTRAFSSSNQLRTTWICTRARRSSFGRSGFRLYPSFQNGVST